MRNLRILAALGLLTAAGAANAGVSSTWTATNDYDFRGNSQSAKDPALQGSVDFATDGGWYVGAWGSNIDFGDPLFDGSQNPVESPDIEVDLYTGFTGSTGEGGATWDAGIIYYAYPDEGDFNYAEIYGSIAYDWFKGKIWYSNAFGGDYAETFDEDAAAWYVEGNATIQLPADLSLLAHLGYSTGDYWDNIYGDDLIDYSVGVGYTVGKFNLALKYVDTDGDVEVTSDEFNNEGRVIFTVATTFPWASD
jgi:uncharacterized protein (TIGR02001 family)